MAESESLFMGWFSIRLVDGREARAAQLIAEPHDCERQRTSRVAFRIVL